MLGIATLNPVWETVRLSWLDRLTQVAARLTAAVASISPAPNLWLWLMLAGATGVFQSVSDGFTFLAERIRISCTSRQPRFGLASNISATTPDAVGVAEEVPPKSLS